MLLNKKTKGKNIERHQMGLFLKYYMIKPPIFKVRRSTYQICLEFLNDKVL